MAEKAIVLSAFEVQAVLDNRKTQLRRVVKPQPPSDYIQLPRIEASSYVFGKSASVIDQLNSIQVFPKYQPGDLLWVQETWRPYRAWSGGSGTGCEIEYKAGGETKILKGILALPTKITPWRSPVTMPREAARIFLRVTDVKVERVQEISEADAISEGVTWEQAMECGNEHFVPTYYNPDNSNPIPDYIAGYECLWGTLNAKRGYGWDRNPWVWVYNFERLEARG